MAPAFTTGMIPSHPDTPCAPQVPFQKPLSQSDLKPQSETGPEAPRGAPALAQLAPVESDSTATQGDADAGAMASPLDEKKTAVWDEKSLWDDAEMPLTWAVEASRQSLSIENPIRKITDSLAAVLAAPSAPAASDAAPVAPSKPLISLGQGDPTAFGHLKLPDVAVRAVQDAIASGRYNGYPPSNGLPDARRAVAEFCSTTALETLPPATSAGCAPACSAADVYITGGCGPSIQLCLDALANPGRNILLPRPGFPVYECMCLHSGLEPRFYDLLPEKNWEVDLRQVAILRDENTVAMLVCNPGNPCGQVFSRKHLVEILTTAAALRLPIIADEVYEGIAFQEATPFIPLRAAAVQLTLQHPQQPQQSHADHAANSPAAAAGSNEVVGNGVHVGNGHVVSGELTHEAVQKKAAPVAAAVAAAAGSVPILTVSSLSKRFLVPGWRVGWIAVHDPRNILRDARVIESLERLLQYAPQPCSLIQAALPAILNSTPPSFLRHLNCQLADAARTSLARVGAIPGLGCPSEPQGGMFLMVRVDLGSFPSFPDDISWCRQLLQEQRVVLIPGTAFRLPGWFVAGVRLAGFISLQIVARLRRVVLEGPNLSRAIMSGPFVAGVAVATAALAARYGIEAWQAFKARPAVPRIRRFYEGGFQPTMTRREAALILGIRESAAQEKVREAHRRVMTANHPDAGGSDLLASKINEAKDLLLGQTKGSGSAF
ncbi:unnamed protein product [Closterium sp. Yama58-4]|nr:unnamed protein product [Closterium sp. Yama58-4]